MKNDIIIKKWATVNNTPQASIILSTYNQPRYLELVCIALTMQTNKNFEVIICDDGSTAETLQCIEAIANLQSFNLLHLWQPDVGFRKSRILNVGITNASSNYCIFLDGDCIPHPHFVDDHLQEAENGKYLCGRRIDLGPKLSKKITSETLRKNILSVYSYKIWLSSLQKDSKRVHRAIHLKHKLLRNLLGYQFIEDLKGCNFSVSKNALLQINGFDEAYEGYGREDTDVEIRLQNLGLKIKSLKGIAIQFHLWHPEKQFVATNDEYLKNAILQRQIKAKQGINK